MTMDELLTVIQVAKMLKVSNMTVYRYIKAKKLTVIKVGRDYRIKQTEFDKFLERNKNK